MVTLAVVVLDVLSDADAEVARVSVENEVAIATQTAEGPTAALALWRGLPGVLGTTWLAAETEGRIKTDHVTALVD
jgi:hypothetical protein